MVVRAPTSVASPLALALALLASVLATGVAVVVALVATGPLADVPVVYAFPAIGALYAATGLLAWSRRPANRTGALLVCAGATWLGASLANTSPRVLIAIGTVTAVLPVSFVLHLLHASPGGRLHGRTSTAAVVAGYVVGVVLQAPLWAFRPQPAPYDVLLVAARPDLAQAGYRVQQAVGAVVVAVTVGVLVRRLREHEPEQRRVLAPLFGLGVLAVVAIPLVANVLRPLLGLGPQLTAALQLTTIALVPLGFLGMVLRGGYARTSGLSAFVTSVASSSGSHHELEQAVAATLGDPTAALLRWSTAVGHYEDAAGQVVELPRPGRDRAAVRVGAGDDQLAAVVYDARLVTDPDTVAAVGRVAAIALERERLAEQVSTSRALLQEASSRLLEDGDQQRRRLAQDLHDGLQGALVRLSMQAHRLAAEVADDGDLAGRLAADVDEAAATLRAIVHGVLPPPLVERGLAAAVQALTDDLPLPATLDVRDVPSRLPVPVETTAYFIVSEALTNVIKHASADAVSVSLVVEHDVLWIDVVDDGVGGARTDGSGSGLRGLRDRTAVLGGTLSLDSGPGGTRLRAGLPCG